MKVAGIGLAAVAGLAMVLGGCAGDVSREISSNVQVRDRVFTAIAGNAALAQEMTQRLLASDSLRTRVVETMLHDSKSAQYVLSRIAHEPDAVDIVLQAAAEDSLGRQHLFTLLKGMQMMARAPK